MAGPVSNVAAIHSTPHPYRWVMLAGAWMIYACFGLTTTSVAPLVGPITHDLGLSHTQMGSVLGAWPLIYVGAAIPCGALLDRIGLRRGLLLAALVMGASGLVRALAFDYGTLFLGVALFGLGGPMISIGAPKLIAMWFQGHERGVAMGIYITGPSVGGIASLSLTNSVVMPLFDQRWPSVFLLYAAIVFCAGLVWLAMSSHEENRAVERHAAAQPRPRQFQVFGDLIRLRPVQFVLVMALGMFFANHGFNNWLPELLRSKGMDAATAGFWASVPTAMGVVGALLIPRHAIPERRFWMLAGLFFGLGVASLMLQAQDLTLLAPALLLQGITRSSMMTIAMLILMETPGVDPRNMGAAGGLFFSFAEIGGALGPLTMGYLIDTTSSFAAPLLLVTAISSALLVILAVLRRATIRAAASVGHSMTG